MNDKTNDYFNLHINGLGYLQRVREVAVKGKQGGYLACDINALVGASDQARKVRFDLIVTSSAEADLLAICEVVEQHGLEDPKIFVSFRAGDLDASLFTYRSGAHAGETGISLKARLLRLSSCSINGTTFELPSAREETAKAATLSSTPSAQAATPQTPKRAFLAKVA